MAANFGAEATEVGDLPVNVTAKAGVAEAPVALQGLTDIFTDATSLLKGRREKKEQGVVGEFARKQLLIAEGLSQGKFRNSAHAQMVSRQNLLNAIQANPAMTKELISTQSSLMGLSGGAKIVSEGTKEEQRMEARKDTLVANGLVVANATDDEFAAADSAARVAVAAAERHKTRMQTLEEESKSISLTSARRAEIEAQKKAETERFVADSAPASFRRVRTEFDKILASDASESEKVQAIKGYYSEWQASTAATLGSVDSGMRDALKGSFDRLEEQYIDLATGASSDAEAERSIKRTMTSMEAIAMQDPLIAKSAVTKKLYGEEGLTKVLTQSADRKATEAFLKFFAAGPGEQVDMDTLFTSDKATKIGQREGLNSVTDALVSGDEAKSQEAVGKIGQILESLEDDAGKITRDPKKAIAVVDWIASPGFLKAIKANPDAFTNLDGVQNILEQNYHDEVTGMIRREFTENKVLVARPVSEVGPRGHGEVPAGTLVEAVPVDGGMTFVAIDPNNAQARNKAKSLNNSLKPIINTSIKAQAHLAGRSDYKAIWEESADAILGGQMSGAGDTDLPGGDAGDDLTTEDFFFPQAKIESLPPEVAEDTEFVGMVEELSSKYEIDPAHMLAVMDFETGGSFDPAQKNAAGSSGTGLIQFMAKTARGLGTSTQELASMTRSQQMKFVESYFDQFASRIKGGDASDVYMSVLYPKAIGKPDDYVVFRKGDGNYEPNKGLDKSGDGTVTKKEAAAKVLSLVSKYS